VATGPVVELARAIWAIFNLAIERSRADATSSPREDDVRSMVIWGPQSNAPERFEPLRRLLEPLRSAPVIRLGGTHLARHRKRQEAQRRGCGPPRYRNPIPSIVASFPSRGGPRQLIWCAQKPQRPCRWEIDRPPKAPVQLSPWRGMFKPEEHLH